MRPYQDGRTHPPKVTKRQWQQTKEEEVTVSFKGLVTVFQEWELSKPNSRTERMSIILIIIQHMWSLLNSNFKTTHKLD